MADHAAHEEGNIKTALDAVQQIAADLGVEADDRVAKRDPIEKRWLQDLKQYHGQYATDITADLIENKKSSLYINATRPKTNVMESRLSDMLFPTDDRNWGIGPTPVPELTVEAENVASTAADAKLAMIDHPDDDEYSKVSADANAELVIIQTHMEEARRRSRAMEEEIDDHLRECKYSIQARDVIRDGCKIGTGIFKGPVTDGKPRRSWVRETASNIYKMVFKEEQQPAFWRVDPWNFFPDSDATNMEENEAVYERHLLNPKQMRKLARQPGFDKDAFRRLLKGKPLQVLPNYLADLRSITSSYNDLLKDRFHVWEYHGPLTADQMLQLSVAKDEPDKAKDIGDADPLDEMDVVIWFCQQEVLKFGFHHLDSGDGVYSVFNLEKDEASIFGFGVPYIMRDGQAALAGAWRMLMDNMGLSSGPQIVINEEAIEPIDGNWEIVPRKVWRRKTTGLDKQPFETFDIPSNMEELLTVIDQCKENIDEETNLPMIAQGEQGSQVTKTAAGMSLLMNSVNVVFRRIVKNWDDDITTPNITRMYDWLMQFSDKDRIKGDYHVDARGTSVLLVREMQSANMMTFLQLFPGHPVLGKFLKDEGLPALRRLAQTMMVPADEVILTDAEIKEKEAKEADLPLPVDPEMEKITASLNLERMKGENAMLLAGFDRETKLIQLAATSNQSLEELRESSDASLLELMAKLQQQAAEIRSKERMMQVEAAVTARQPPEQATGGGHF